jgi:predicted deacylase
MMGSSVKKTLLASLFLVVVAAVITTSFLFWLFVFKEKKSVEKVSPEVVKEEVQNSKQAVIGTSVEGRNIESYTFGTGDTNILLVGGIHGGYEWNSVMLAYQFIDYYTANPKSVPENITLTIVPAANPDGVFAVTKKEGRFVVADTKNEDTSAGLGRFNANKVDLNRNFACKWQPKSSWKGNIVSAGTEAFSEPESKAIKSVVASLNPVAVIFFHSQAGAIYASECENGILPMTRKVMNAYSLASGYKTIDVFDSYQVTGDAEGWLASIGIPAITVELETHETIQWEKNIAGVKAVLDYFKK